MALSLEAALPPTPLQVEVMSEPACAAKSDTSPALAQSSGVVKVEEPWGCDTTGMHTFSMASAIAIARLMDNPPPELIDEAAVYVELARVHLALDVACLTAAMVFAQPLIKRWQPCWKFAYTVGLSLGAKYVTEGFYLADIHDQLTDEFGLENLQKGEEIALEGFDFGRMNLRFRNFRNALADVAMEQPLAADDRPDPIAMVVGMADDEFVHVLIVDPSARTCAAHRQLVLDLRPDAKVHTCQW